MQTLWWEVLMPNVSNQLIQSAHDADLASLIRRNGVELKASGAELRGLCPFHDEKTPSFYVNVEKGVYHCHGCGASGDSVTFLRRYGGLAFPDAVRELAGYADDGGAPPHVAGQPPRPADGLELVVPIPTKAPPVPKRIRVQESDEWIHLEAVASWLYLDANGETLFYVQRFEDPSSKKTIRPATLWRDVKTGELQWLRRAFPTPRPIYGLVELATYPEAQVLICEGEKATDAAQRLLSKAGMFGKVVAITWPGGANGTSHVDWESLRDRTVVLWPDADGPGEQAANDISDRLAGIAIAVKRLSPPERVAQGWDAADAEKEEGFDLLEFVDGARLVWPVVHHDAEIPLVERDESHLVQATSVDACGKQLIVTSADESGSALLFDPAEMLPPQLPRNADARDGSQKYFPLTEKGNSYRIANLHGQNIRFVGDLNEFIAWDRGRWVRDPSDRLLRAAVGHLPKEIKVEAEHHGQAGSTDDAGYALKWAQKSGSAAVIANTVTLVKDILQLHVPFASIDANPMLAGFDGARQVIDLNTGEVRLARRDDLVTRALGVSHVGDALKACRWEKFLNEVFSEDQELIDWFSRWVGYCLTGQYTEQIFVFCFGAGANGKSVLLKVLETLFGGYGAVVHAGTLMEQQRTGKEASPDVLGMAGARILLGSEVAQGEAFDERFLKSWTGGDRQKARALYGKNVDFEPMGKLMIAGNHRPRIVGTDAAVWRRVRLVPFGRKFAEHERDPALVSRLIEELPHVAAWAIAGCQEWQKRGLTETPKSVKEATAGYATEQDTLGEFLAEKTEAGGECSSAELFIVYKSWAQDCNIRAMSRQAFGVQLHARDIKLKHGHNGNKFVGVQLRRIFEEPNCLSDGLV
jgi:P4 family phage/plasmid primase-like protien